MPVYGSDKRRQMARSILPSTMRCAAEDQRRIRRRHRRTVRQELGLLRGRSADLFACETPQRRPRDEAGDLGDLTAWPQPEIRDLVLYRRLSDKLSHFERWAVAVSAPLPVEDRASRLQAALPGGVIGDHAMSHLRFLPAIVSPGEHEQYRWWRRPQDEATPADPVPVLAARLRAVIAAGGHGDLNRHLRRMAPSGRGEGRPDVRLLLGLHDCDVLAAELCRRRKGKGWLIPRDELEEYLDARGVTG